MEEKKQQTNYFVPISILLAGLLIAGALYLVGNNNKDKTTQSNPTSNTTGQQTPSDRIDVSAVGPSQGSQNAKVTIVEFSDYQCPFCAAYSGFAPQVIASLKQRDPSWEAPYPKIVSDYINTGKVRYVFRDFPAHGPLAQKAAEAARCAGDQNKYWEMHEKLFEKQDEWDTTANVEESFKKYAADLGLKTDSFASCLSSEKYKAQVEQDYADGKKAGITGTPTFSINGRLLVGAYSYSQFKTIIEE